MRNKLPVGAEPGIRFGVSDIDGSQPPSYRDTLGAPPQQHQSYKD